MVPVGGWDRQRPGPYGRPESLGSGTPSSRGLGNRHLHGSTTKIFPGNRFEKSRRIEFEMHSERMIGRAQCHADHSRVPLLCRRRRLRLFTCRKSRDGCQLEVAWATVRIHDAGQYVTQTYRSARRRMQRYLDRQRQRSLTGATRHIGRQPLAQHSLELSPDILER